MTTFKGMHNSEPDIRAHEAIEIIKSSNAMNCYEESMGDTRHWEDLVDNADKQEIPKNNLNDK